MFKRITVITATAVAAFALAATSGTGMTPTAAPVRTDCDRVAKADRKLCAQVRAQHAYGWTTVNGKPQTWVPNGRALVREITHQGLTKREMHSYLTGQRADYRAHVTAVPFSVDRIVKVCGNTDGAGVVTLVDGDGKPGGEKYTWARITCA